MKLTVAALLLSSQLFTSVSGAGEGYTYFEEGGLGPSNWASALQIDDNQCGGTAGKSGYGQSPVTIDEATGGSCNTGMSQYSFTGGNCQWTDLEFSINNGGVKVAPKTDCVFGSMNIPHSPNKFNALQFHVHTFSEHQILGQGDSGYFPAELHVVHQEETAESFAVFGTMISVGAEDHPVFEWFLQGWEAVAQQVEDECVAGTSFLDDGHSVVENYQCSEIGSRTIFNGTSPDFPAGGPNVYELPTNPDFGTFTYKGGLTTPACTEIVNWNLLDTPMEISANQLDRLKSLILCYVSKHEAEDGSLESCGHGTVASETGSTSRPPQPLLGRTVLHRCPDGPDVVIDDIGVVVQEEDASNTTAPKNEEGEDDNTVSGGMIALYVIIGLVVLCGAFYAIHMNLAKAQAARIQKRISQSIASTVTLRGGSTPEALIAEFRKADKNGNGTLNKEKVRTFVGPEIMDDRDFEAMFAVIDIDNRGTVNCSEFSSFVSQCDMSAKDMKGDEENGGCNDEKVAHT